MYRDGANKSLWQAEIKKFSSMAELLNDSYDVVIIGAGITGVTSALNLQKQNRKCLLVESANIGFGTTGGTTAHLNNFFDATYSDVIKDFGLDNAKLLARSGNEAIDIIRQNIDAYGIDCGFAEKTGYLFSLDEKQTKELDDIVEASNEAGVPMKEVQQNPFPIPYDKIAEVPGQAQFHPIQYIRGLLNQYLAIGGKMIEECRALEVEKQQEELVVITTLGIVKCKNVIYATHIPPGKNVLHFRNAPYRSYALAVKLRNGIYPDALGYDLCEPYHYYRCQEVDGEQYLIAGGEDHKTGETENTEASFQKLEAYVLKYFDVSEIVYRWSSQYYEPVDGLPYIGQLPGNPDNVYVSTGYNGNGMIFGTLGAQILSDLIVHGESAYAQLFSPARVKPVAGFTSFVKENANVVKHLVMDKITVEKIQSLTELNDNEAKVVKYNGETMAVFKDARGRVHVLSHTCTHLGCNVVWNESELSWDCPCHGSRFGIDGEVLTAPAVKGLVKFSPE